MNTGLARAEVQDYLLIHEQTALDKFIFKGSPFSDISIQELAQQLEGRRRIKSKLPLWHKTSGILFPPKLNLEQTSSQCTAQYKASIVRGTTLLDMTGGFGVDSYYFAQQVQEVHHVEMNEELAAFAKANFNTLQSSNIKTTVGDALDYLTETSTIYDTIYLDPARRDDVKGKVFKLQDCLPNVPKHLSLLCSKGKNVLIKTSPLLDIRAGLNALEHVRQIHIVAVNNEVKELLWSIDSSGQQSIAIITINKRGSHIEQTSCSLKEIAGAVATYDDPKKFLYEPNAALMKSGAFNWICEQYGLAKLHPHSHLYTNDVRIPFPGRVFKIIEVLPFDNKLKKRLSIKKANITTRNFKLSVDALRKKLSIKDGGEHYLFFTTDTNEKQVVVVCEKA